jgi:hypothetical protein
MAVTRAALQASVIRPIRRDEPYPEHFHQAMRRWLKLREAGEATLCATTVTECLSDGERRPNNELQRARPAQAMEPRR